jgi:hypothetical protein
MISISFSFLIGENIGFCLDVKGKVQRTGKIRNGIIRKGDIIYNGDKIITGSNGFVSYAFIYEKTNLKVFENTVVKLNTDRENFSSYSKLALFGGKIIVQTEEISDEPFTVWSPSSICQIENSHIIIEYKNELLYNDNSYCLLTSLYGMPKVENIRSKEIMYLKNGETIASTMDGKFLQLETFRSSSEIQNTLRLEKQK